MARAELYSIFTRDGSASELGKAGLANWKTAKRLSAREDLAVEGDSPDTVSLVINGWGCRYKQLTDGRRHMISVILPGELCDHFVSKVGPLDHTVAAITPMTVAQLSRAEFDRYCTRLEVVNVIWTEDLLREARARERLVSLGLRNSLERLAHFLCSIFVRLMHIGQCDGRECPLPLTQGDLADLTGMTAVHVNRTLQQLRAEGLIEFTRGKLVVPDFQVLADLADFDPAYLRLPGPD